MEAEFPAIVINIDFAPKDILQCKSQVSIPINDEIKFRISFDESDDEDYIIICDKNSFSYKMISVNNLKTDSKNDYEEVMPSILSPEPAINCFDDLDFFKDFENEFTAIIYKDAQMSKSDLLTEPILNPQHIDEFDLNDETSLSEYDEEEQNVLRFKFLYSCAFVVDFAYMALPPCEQRHKFLRYEGLEYTDLNIADFESRMVMEHHDKAGVVVFTSQAWGRLFGTRGLLIWELILEFLSILIFRERDISTDRDFLGPPPSYTFIRDLVLRLCHMMMAHNIARRSQAPEKVTVTDLFYLRLVVNLKDGWLDSNISLIVSPFLRGVHYRERRVIFPAWVAMGPERQPDVAAGAPIIAKDAPAVNEDD
ncbi:hypothetical protein Tco_0475386 [Tanacetum coccineum]